MERLFGIDAQLLFDAALMAVNMLVLFAALSYFLFNPVKELLAKRQERIEGEQAKIAADQKDAAELKKQYEDKLSQIQKEAEEILSDARKRGMKSEERIIAEAKEEAARIISHAQSEAKLERQKVADAMKQEMIQVATLMAGKVVSASIDESTQKALLEETLKEIGDGTWLS